MSSYPPPSSTNDYPPIYPATPNNAQVNDGHGQGLARGPYPQEPPFPKIENLNEVLQAHALHANHALNDQRAPGAPQQLPHGLPQSQSQQPKPNRLRKACDSCSIRKVKVNSLSCLSSGLRALGHGIWETRYINAHTNAL